MRNKYVTLTAIPDGDTPCDAPEAYRTDEAKIVFTEKDRGGHYVYRQRLLTPPPHARDRDGYVLGCWRDSAAFWVWLEHEMDEFAEELDGEYDTLDADAVLLAAPGRETAEVVDDHRWN